MRNLLTVITFIALCALGASSPGIVVGPDYPAFTMAKLRAIDPCALLDRATLGPFGSSSTAGKPTGFDECAVGMKDLQGNDLSVTVSLGAQVSTLFSGTTLSGMQVREIDGSSGGCEEMIITQAEALKFPGMPTNGIRVEVDDVEITPHHCDLARRITTAIIDRIKANPPQRRTVVGSLATVDPCSAIDASKLTSGFELVAAQDMDNLHDCNWVVNGVSVDFRIGDAAKPGFDQQIDLDGIAAYESWSDSGFSCDISWNIRPTGASNEFVDVDFGIVEPRGWDRVRVCATTLMLAKAVLPRIPRPS